MRPLLTVLLVLSAALATAPLFAPETWALPLAAAGAAGLVGAAVIASVRTL